LTSLPFEDPQLFVLKGQELPLSGIALLELMRAVINRNLPFRFCARGWSMAPFIRDGDVITVAPLQHAVPKVGEVVAFTRPGEEKMVVHRIVAQRSEVLFIQGDNGQGYPEDAIPLNNLIGRVVRIERNGNNIWIGLGPERYAIAWLSRVRLLTPLRAGLSLWQRLFSRRTR
jgi:signal peptidase I